MDRGGAPGPSWRRQRGLGCSETAASEAAGSLSLMPNSGAGTIASDRRSLPGRAFLTPALPEGLWLRHALGSLRSWRAAKPGTIRIFAQVCGGAHRDLASPEGRPGFLSRARTGVGVAPPFRESSYRSGRFDRWIKVKNRQHPAFARAGSVWLSRRVTRYPQATRNDPELMAVMDPDFAASSRLLPARCRRRNIHSGDSACVDG
jgi:hypothetical protein